VKPTGQPSTERSGTLQSHEPIPRKSEHRQHCKPDTTRVGSARAAAHHRKLMNPTREPLDASLLELLDTLYQRQVRQAAAEVAAAIAHAAGTPLNVIGGRAELIRQDPANAAGHVTRIEEQVRKLADGLRQFVDYLTIEDGSARRASGETRPMGDVPAARLLEQLLELVQPLALARQVELVTDVTELGSARAAEQTLANLVTLLSWAVRRAPAASKVQLRVAAAPGGALFELQIPGLPPPRAWRLEHFDARESADDSEPFRIMAVCAAVARGQGGKLLADATTDASGAPSGIQIRLLCRTSEG
jgi:two-component system OmpR family sensor kinase